MKKQIRLNRQRQNRKLRVSNKVKRYSTRPRLVVFRSHKHISAQIIDDSNGKTLVSASSLDKVIRSSLKYGGNCVAAAEIGAVIAKRALAAGVTQVAFDRRGFKYHGRVRTLADAARDGGLDIGVKQEEN
ncbi:MAG: 50S ribosomal protein L18 [Planctomycetaceae bacterium]|nr:50S ribosomal protein L18 [Planctomycetaceae bacterium]